jgi:hypothetical protein
VGIGNTPTYKLDVTGVGRITGNADQQYNFRVQYGSTGFGIYQDDTIGFTRISAYDTTGTTYGKGLTFATATAGSATTERMRIDSTGRFWSGDASPWTVGSGGANCWALYNGGDFPISAASQSTITAIFNRCNSTGTIVEFKYNAGVNGSVSTNGTNVAYNTSSDYRLKENILPMTNALSKVAQLKPVTYKWKINGSDGEGFIAHELAEVCPQAVHGTKDAVDVDGKPIYQGIDVSFLVATLTAAIQEQQATINALTARIETLENK